jgi:hypothetical protein
MNVIEKQSKLGKDIFEINTNTLKELASLQKDNIEKYFDANRAYGEKLPEVKDVTSFVSLQREYTEGIWNGVKDAVSAHTGIVRGAFEETRHAFEEAYTTTSKAAKPAQKTKAKPKAKAKAKAKTKAETSAAA